jgi:Txe/YoeB family toxin of Txe-Axe toxin-antitoxin module
VKSFEEPLFKKDLKKLLKENLQLLSKLEILVVDVRHHPKTGLGHPKPLAGYGKREVWSRTSAASIA